MANSARMDLDLVISGNDEATYTETLNRSGIKVEVKISMDRESLLAKTPVDKRLIEQSTTKINAEVSITDGDTKVITTNAGAIALHFRGFRDSRRGLRVSTLPPSIANDATINTRALAITTARKIMRAAIREQSRNATPKLATTLGLLGNVVKYFAIDMNIMKMNVIGLQPFTTTKQSKCFCETVVMTTESTSNAASSEANPRENIE